MIVKLKPALKHYLWGGTKLKTEFNKQTNEQTVAETWELSFNDNGHCFVDGGKNGGKRLIDVATQADFGANCQQFDRFPALVKLIDSAQSLSLQVHPSDDYALVNEQSLGKTEMWHILSAAKDAFIYLGFNRTVTREEFLGALNDKTLCSLLNKVTVKTGDTYFVPSGTIHAIGAGVTLIEVQQNSDLTYRVWDFDRLGVDGKPRQLHIDKALKVLNFDKYDVPSPKRREFLGKCKYFAAYRITAPATVFNADSFTSVTSLSDGLKVGALTLNKGETAFVSAGEHAQIDGAGECVLVTVEK